MPRQAKRMPCLEDPKKAVPESSHVSPAPIGDVILVYERNRFTSCVIDNILGHPCAYTSIAVVYSVHERAHLFLGATGCAAGPIAPSEGRPNGYLGPLEMSDGS